MNTEENADTMREAYAAWEDARSVWISKLVDDPAGSDPHQIAAMQSVGEATMKVADIPIDARQDAVLLMHVMWVEFGPHLAAGNLAEEDFYLDPVDQFIAAAWRAASGRSGLPRHPHKEQ